MTEIHAALGLANLKYYDSVLLDRKNKYFFYKTLLSGLNEISFQEIQHGESNYSYFPIIFNEENLLINVLEELNINGIYSRRYFYPSINLFTKIVQYQNVPISESISKCILCLPLYYELDKQEILNICHIIINLLNRNS